VICKSLKNLSFALTSALTLIGSQPVSAQRDATIRTSFVHLGNGVPGAYYEPAPPDPKAGTAIFIMHSSADYLSFSGCTELSKRGYRVLCANNSTGKSGVSNDGALDQVLLEIKAGVAWLRQQPGVRHIVLLGHSGGGTIMSAYQYIAESGVKACQTPDKIWKCPDTLVGLPAADGLMLVDSNWGLAAMTLFSIDPAVKDEGNGTTLDPALDMYNPANGFQPTGSTYPAAFTSAFLLAEGKRNNALIARAQATLAAIDAGHGPYADDAPFVVPGAVLLGSNNKLFSQDVRLMAHTRKAWPLIHANGSITTQVVSTVRVPENLRSQSPSFIRGALKTSVRNYLSSYAIRTTPDFGYGADGVQGVEWTSSYASPPGNVQGVSKPLFVLGMTGHWEFLAAETIYDLAKSKDKSLSFIEGATHLYTTCTKCEPRPGAFGDTLKTTYDTIDDWLSRPDRFATKAQ
jgi:pimeloyl-ACP methyl ester carboxylesterase